MKKNLYLFKVNSFYGVIFNLLCSYFSISYGYYWVSHALSSPSEFGDLYKVGATITKYYPATKRSRASIEVKEISGDVKTYAISTVYNKNEVRKIIADLFGKNVYLYIHREPRYLLGTWIGFRFDTVKDISINDTYFFEYNKNRKIYLDYKFMPSVISFLMGAFYLVLTYFLGKEVYLFFRRVKKCQ